MKRGILVALAILAAILLVSILASRGRREPRPDQAGPAVLPRPVPGANSSAIAKSDPPPAVGPQPGREIRVLSFDGRPVSGAVLTVVSRTHRCRQRAPGGAQPMRVVADSAGIAHLPGELKPEQRVILEAAGQPRTTISADRVRDEIRFERPVLVSGRVVFEGASPPGPATIRATLSSFDRADRPRLEAETDAHGCFRFGPVPDGIPFQLRAERSQWIPAVSQILKAREGTTVELSLRRGLSLRGRVVTSKELPIVGAFVRSVQGEARQTATTDFEGKFVLSGLESEALTLVVQGSGYRQRILDNLRPGSEQEIRLER